MGDAIIAFNVAVGAALGWLFSAPEFGSMAGSDPSAGLSPIDNAPDTSVVMIPADFQEK